MTTQNQLERLDERDSIVMTAVESATKAVHGILTAIVSDEHDYRLALLEVIARLNESVRISTRTERAKSVLAVGAPIEVQHE